MRTYGTASLNRKENAWWLDAEPHVMMRFRRIFPRITSHRSGAIALKDTDQIRHEILWVLDMFPLDISSEDLQVLNLGRRKHRGRQEQVDQILKGGKRLDHPRDIVIPEGISVDQKQLAAQRAGADILLTTGGLLIGDDVGLGKTLSGILPTLNPETLPALIVTLTHLPEQWLEEFNKWTPWLRCHILKKGTPYELDHYHEWREDKRPKRCKGEPEVILTGYSKLRGWADHLTGLVRYVAFDEVQELRHNTSAKYEAAAQIADRADWRLGLSATPVYNYGGEAFNIYDILAPDVLGSRTEFEREWGCQMGNHMGVKEPNALGHYLMDQNLLLRRRSEGEGALRIPHKIDTDKKKLDALTEDAIGLAEMLTSGEGEGRERWKAAGRLDWKLRKATGIAKAPFVADFTKMLLESGEQVLLFGWHHRVYQIWGERLAAYNPVFYSGQESTRQKAGAKQAFLSGHSRVLCMSLRSGAGLDGLEKVCHIAVFGELDWSPAMHTQAIGRLRPDRPTQKERVLAYFLVSRAGSDPVIAETLNVKKMQSEPMMNPDDDPMTEAPNVQGRVRRLAEDFLAKRGKR